MVKAIWEVGGLCGNAEESMQAGAKVAVGL